MYCLPTYPIQVAISAMPMALQGTFACLTMAALPAFWIRIANGARARIAAICELGAGHAIIMGARSAVRRFATRRVDGANIVDTRITTVRQRIADSAFVMLAGAENGRRAVLVELAIDALITRLDDGTVPESRRVIADITCFPSKDRRLRKWL